MELQELYRMIGLEAGTVEKLEEIDGIEQAGPYWEGMMETGTAAQAYTDLERLLQPDPDCWKMLYCQLECARRVFDRYQEKHIPEAVFAGTMKCFARFIGECGKKNGRKFFDRGWWTYRQLSMNIFRLGELEYQFQEYEGEKAIGLHIPSDASLSAAAVDRSLEQAGTFFRTYYPDFKYRRYICRSWLLSPALRSLLPEQSHIRDFQDRFSIVQEDWEDMEYIEWLFQSPKGTGYQTLPAATSLQRNGKALLLAGGKIGSALGIMAGLEDEL